MISILKYIEVFISNYKYIVFFMKKINEVLY